MKVYISADIEGVCGISHWDETKLNHPDYRFFQQQLIKEVVAACEGAKQAGASQVTVRDAHETGRNIISSMLPPYVTLKRGWSGHPFSMVEGIEEGYDALLMIAYHSAADSGTSPLSHTLSTRTFKHIKINGQLASELTLFALAAASVNVPLVLVSGDAGLKTDVDWLNPKITHIATNSYIGDLVTSCHPDIIVEKIKQETKVALDKTNIDACKIKLPTSFDIDIEYRRHQQAYKASFYPGVERISDCSVRFKTDNYYDTMRNIMWLYTVGHV